jgi:hypothetical protein
MRLSSAGTMCEDPKKQQSPKLTVLASTAVVAADGFHILVVLGLAIDAEAHTGHGLPAGLGDFRVALFTAFKTRTSRKLIANTADRVLDCRIYLVLHRPVFCESTGHL